MAGGAGVTRKVVVVGAGFGGLAAACELAARGAEVTLLERAAVPGGKAQRVAHGGFAWDTGPTLLTLPAVLDEVLGLAGMRLRDAVRAVPLSPLCRYRFASGATLDHHADRDAMVAGIGAIDARDAAQWPAFEQHVRALWETVGRAYVDEPFTGALDLAARSARRGAGTVAMQLGLRTLGQHAARWFRSPEMRQFVGRFATYVGASPFRAPAALAMIAAVEGAGDAVYPVGGMARVAAVFADAARRLGVTLRLDEPVRRIERDGKGWRVSTDARTADADAVLLDVDPLYAATLFDDGSAARDSLDADRGRTRSLSALVLHVALRGRTEPLALHNVLFPANYAAEFDDVMERGALPSDGTVYVAAPSPVDAGTAPEGHEALFTLVNAPADLRASDDASVARVQDHVLARLAAVDPSLPGRVVALHAQRPMFIASTGSADGAIYGVAPHGSLGTFRRPLARVAGARGLYLAGGCSHPGGGVPMTVRSGQHAARTLAADLRLDVAPALAVPA